MTTEAKPQAAPPTLASTRERYRQIAPVPDPSAADPGAALGRYLTMTGLRRAFHACFSPDEAEAARVAMAAALLWRRLAAADQSTADLTAGQIATAWADGEGVSEWLHTLAVRSGVDPDEVTTTAATERALIVAKQADAEQAAVEMAQALKLAQDAVESLGKLADSHERVLYAVSVDLSRGDPDSARRLLWEQLDGFDGEPAGDSETGMQWLNRMRAKRQAEVPAQREPSRM